MLRRNSSIRSSALSLTATGVGARIFMPFCLRAMISRWSGRVGAIEKPQLPATTVVTPWKQEGVSAGSQNTCAS
ncbi:hypothetical protein D3C83_108710 [compost metagenome]